MGFAMCIDCVRGMRARERVVLELAASKGLLVEAGSFFDFCFFFSFIASWVSRRMES